MAVSRAALNAASFTGAKPLSLGEKRNMRWDAIPLFQEMGAILQSREEAEARALFTLAAFQPAPVPIRAETLAKS